jgi:hypothetical protein
MCGSLVACADAPFAPRLGHQSSVAVGYGDPNPQARAPHRTLDPVTFLVFHKYYKAIRRRLARFAQAGVQTNGGRLLRHSAPGGQSGGALQAIEGPG